MPVRSPVVIAAAVATLLALAPADAHAQRRAIPRGAVVVRPPVVVRPVVYARPTVFIGGYYYPAFYRASLYYGYGGSYDPWRPWPVYQWPPYYGYNRYDLSGNVRTQVQPRETEVFIDGYYAGRVDDFDGVFQRLHIEPGDHEIQLYLPGHRLYSQRVYVQPGRTFNIRHTMEPLAPGEPEPARPSGAPLPAAGARYPGGPDPNAGPGRRPAPPARAGAPEAEGFGLLSLRVQPGDAEVLIDGERWEGGLDAERLEVQLKAGVHRLEIRREGYRSYFTDITIGDSQTRTLNVALTKN